MPNKMPKASTRKTKLGRKSVLIALVALLGSVILIIWVTDGSKVKPIKTSTSSECSGLKLEERCVPLERAETEQAHAKGLSDRDSLLTHSGMLFVFDHADKQCFWMKDMRFNLDMIWVDAQRKVVKIKSDISPATYPQSFCADNAQYVVELNSGEARELGLSVGQLLRF